MIREVAAKLGVEVDGQAALTTMNGALDKAKGLLSSVAAGLAAGAAVKFIKEQIDAADALGDTSAQLGLNIDELQRFQYAVKLTGGEAEGANKAIFLLNKTLGTAAEAGSPAAAEFASLGINIKGANGHVKSAMEVLPELADKVAEAGTAGEQTAIATKFFGKASKDLLPLLKRGREGLAELSKEYDDLGLGLSQDFVQAAGEANDQMDRAEFATKALKSQLVVGLLPAITKVVGWVIKSVAWFNKLSKETKIIQVLTAFLGAALVVKLVPAVLTAVRAFMALRTAMFGANIPLWLVIAGITALILIAEDLWTMLEGGDSLIGRLLDKFGGIGTKDKVIRAFKDTWRTLVDSWTDAKTTLADLWKQMGPDVVSKLSEAFGFLVKTILAGVKGLTAFVGIGTKLASGDVAGAVKEATETTNAIFGTTKSQKSIGADGKVTEVKESVGGLFGISDKEYQAKLGIAGLGPKDLKGALAVQNQLAVTVVAPGAEADKVKVTATNNQDAFHGVVTGVSK